MDYILQLVGHNIQPGGIAITGQEQTQFGGGFLEGKGKHCHRRVSLPSAATVLATKEMCTSN